MCNPVNVDSLLSYTPFLFLFPVLFSSFLSFSALNLYGLPYSSRKPLVYKPPASM